MKRIVCWLLVIAMAITCLYSCGGKESTSKVSETTKKASEETKPTLKETTERPLNKNVRVKIFEQDKKTSYNVVKFGKYDMSVGTSGDVEWLVVDGNDKSYLLVSRYILDCKNYNDSDKEVIWNSSSLNNWLNNYFINRTFSSDEIAYMNPVSEFYLSGKEKVGILNIAACEKYFGREDINKRNYRLSAEATTYAKSNWEEFINNANSEYNNCGSFYLSDNGTTDRKAAYVNPYGHIRIDGQDVKLVHGDGVRPVIVVKRELFGQEKAVAKEESTTEAKEDKALVAENEESTVEETEEIVSKKALISNNPYSNYATSKYESAAIPASKSKDVDLSFWQYGRTPITWVYVKPNTQIICNNSPNKSPAFAYKLGASSGPKGCFMSIFSKGESVGDDWDGRLYTVEDYKKTPPERLDFDPVFDTLTYGDYKVKELLAKRYEIEDVNPGLVKANGVYVNVIYVTELDEIIEAAGLENNKNNEQEENGTN